MTAIILVIVSAFIIEKDGEIKEKFSYEILFNKTTRAISVEYSRANSRELRA